MIQITRYQPGTPEFEEVAKTITPVGRVKQYTERRTYLNADVSGSKGLYRRMETIDKGRTR